MQNFKYYWNMIQNSSIYLMTSIMNSAIPFILMPILTRVLSPTEYGLVSMFSVLVSFVTPFTGLSVHGAVSRMYFERERIDFRSYIYNCLIILFVSSGIVFILMNIFANSITSYTDFPSNMFWTVVVISLCQFVSRIILTLWQVQMKPVSYGIYQISQTLLIALLSIILVVNIKLGWHGRIYGQLIPSIIFMIIGFYILYTNNWINFKFNRFYIKHALKFGVPLIPHVLGGVIMTMIDRVFITNYYGVSANGLYSVGYQIGSIINIISTSFNQAFTPWLYGELKKDTLDAKIKIVRLTYIFFVIIIGLVLVLFAVTPLVFKWFVGEEYSAAIQYVGWIALGYSFLGMYLMVSGYIYYVQKTKYLSIITFSAGITNAILTIILLKINGVVGAAQATAFTYLLQFIFTWLLASKVYKMPWNILKNKKN